MGANFKIDIMFKKGDYITLINVPENRHLDEWIRKSKKLEVIEVRGYSKTIIVRCLQTGFQNTGGWRQNRFQLWEKKELNKNIALL